MSVIYWHETGPKISYVDGLLIIEDLNPEKRIAWRLTEDHLRDIAYAILRITGHSIDPWKGIPENEGFDGPQGAE